MIEHPVLVSAIGGKYVHEDDRTSPTHMAITFKFKDDKPMLTYEHRSWFTNSEAGFRDEYPFVQPGFPVGTIFFGSKGYQIFPDYSSYRSFLGQQCEPGPFKFDPSHTMADLPHFQNWVKAIRSRDHQELRADIEEGHKSMALCLLARTSYQVGRPIQIDPETEQIIGDDEANRMLKRAGIPCAVHSPRRRCDAANEGATGCSPVSAFALDRPNPQKNPPPAYSSPAQPAMMAH